MESVANAAAAEVALVMVASLFALLVAVEVIDRMKNRAVKQPARPRARISESEMRLVGDDYRDHVKGYFGKVNRRRQIIEEVCDERH
jgi:hypothetical protein